MKQLILIISFLFIAAALYLISLPPKEITLEDIHPAVIPRTNQSETPLSRGTVPVDSTGNDINRLDSTEKDVNKIVSARKEGDKISGTNEVGDNAPQVEFYIIVDGFSNFLKAQQRAEQLKNSFNKNFIILPPTAEGYYRISCGKYSTIEEARSSIASIKSKVKSDAWIFSLKK